MTSLAPQAALLANFLDSLLAVDSKTPVGSSADSKAEFSDLLRAQLTLFQYQTQYWQALTRTQQILAELSAAVGEDLSHD